MAQYWLISAPIDNTSEENLEKMLHETTKANMSSNFKFPIPDLQVGTLDLLVKLSDELGQLDSHVESVLKKTSQCMCQVMEDSNEKFQENLLANGGPKKMQESQTPKKMYFQALMVDLVTYLTNFQWDMAKYPIKQPLKGLAEIISKQVSQIDGELKSQMEAYNRLKGNLQAAERKAVGNLLTRTLTDIVKKDDFVLDSEYLTTLLVVVPRTQDTTWEKTYESLSELVVPRSTKKITEDSDGGLFTVTLFKKVVADFRVKARENKFIVREFSYDEAELEAEKEEITRFTTEQKQQYGPLLRWLKVNFSEVFVAWIHMKGLRVFVESVLRYGLPVNFQAVLLQPNEKKIKQLREVLASHFSYLDGRGGGKLDVRGVDIPGMILVNQEYHSYVYFKIDADVANGI